MKKKTALRLCTILAAALFLASCGKQETPTPEKDFTEETEPQTLATLVTRAPETTKETTEIYFSWVAHLEENDRYKFVYHQEDGDDYYLCTIYDENGVETFRRDYFWYEPQLRIYGSLMEIHQGVGTGVYICDYYDLETNRYMLSPSENPFYVHGETVAYFELEDDQLYIVLKHMFGEESQRYPCDIPIITYFGIGGNAEAVEYIDETHIKVIPYFSDESPAVIIETDPLY